MIHPFTPKVIEDTNESGIGWLLAACFLIGDVAGAGLMALPVAMVQGGVVFGSITSLVCCVCAAYSSVLLADCLVIMRRRWPEYRQHHGRPYIAMARRSLGSVGESVLKVMLYCDSVGSLIVMLLLAADNTSSIVHAHTGIHLHKCFSITLLGALLWPLVMPRGPAEAKWIGLLASAASVCAVALIMGGSIHDAAACAPHADYSAPESVETMALAFGTMMFSYGGQACFPTIQMDMKRPQQFAKSIWLSFAVLFCVLYSPVSLLGYYVYGNSMLDTIINSLQVWWVQQAVTVLITVHTLAAYVIFFAPLAQGVEAHYQTPKRFSLHRFLIRSLVLWLSVFVALSVPRFSVILDLEGGSFATALCFICPGLFNVLLTAGEGKRRQAVERREVDMDSEDECYAGWNDVIAYNPWWKLAVVAVIMAIGLVGGVSSTTIASIKLLGAEMETPCYMRFFTSEGFPVSSAGGLVNCCGRGKNVTVWPVAEAAQFCSL